MLFNPQRKTIERVLETSEPLDSLDSIPKSALVSEELQEQEKPDMMDRDSTPNYIFYPSNGKIIKENTNNPEDKQVVNIPGATSPKVDPKNDAIYYIIFDRNIVKESPIGSDKKQFLVKGSDKLASLSHDPKRNMLIFANTDAGTIEALDLATNKRTPVYKGLKSPEKFSFSPDTRLGTCLDYFFCRSFSFRSHSSLTTLNSFIVLKDIIL